MKPPLPRGASAVPRLPHVQIEIAKAIRTLTGEDRDALAKRRADIAAMRRDFDELAHLVLMLRRDGSSVAAIVREHNLDQTSVPSSDEYRTPRTMAILKASQDDPKHPGWPAGTPDGRGGKFRPKDGDASVTLAARSKQSEVERDAQYQADMVICRMIRTPLCYSSAMERYAACLVGRPIPDLRF